MGGLHPKHPQGSRRCPVFHNQVPSGIIHVGLFLSAPSDKDVKETVRNPVPRRSKGKDPALNNLLSRGKQLTVYTCMHDSPDQLTSCANVSEISLIPWAPWQRKPLTHQAHSQTAMSLGSSTLAENRIFALGNRTVLTLRTKNLWKPS